MDSGQLNEKWGEVYRHVKTYDNLDLSQIDAFFPLLKPQAMSDGFLMLTTNNDFIKSWVERRYLDIIKQALLDLYGLPYTVLVEVDPTQTQPAERQAEVSAKGAGSGTARSQENAAALQPMPAAGGQAEPSPMPTTQPNTGMYQQEPTVNPHANAGFAGSAPVWAGGAGSVGSFGGMGGNAQAASGSGAVSAEYTRNDFEPAYDNYRGRETLKEQLDRTFPQPDYTRGAAGNHENAEGPTSALTFENFVVGESNRMAYSMAVSVAEMPGSGPLNPLFIYGKSGLGKTHLMRAIQNYIGETQPYLRTVYVDSAELLSDYMEAGAAHDKEKTSYKNFKTRYEEADVLLIDDIQYLQGKKQTLDIVFQIFNKLTNQGKQIILSADRAPKNIDIDERYHSRFNQGGTIDIQPPEIETKLGIVKIFINEYRRNEATSDFSIPEDIQMYIAENSSSNIRELKSAVTKVIYQMTFFRQHDLTVSDVRTLLENHFSGGSSKNLTIEDIQREVEDYYKVKHADLIGKSRERKISHPRQVAIYLCRYLLDVPYNDIGKKFNRDHSTAMSSVSKIEKAIQKERDVMEEIETLKQIIREL